MTRPSHRPPWNRRELLVHATIFAVIPWIAVLVFLAVPGVAERYGHRPGSDFVHFYILGRGAQAHDGELLYDHVRQHRLQAVLEPTQPGWYAPIYAPQTSLMFAPLAVFPYRLALWLWRLLTTAGFAVAVWLAWRNCARLSREGLIVAIAAAGFPPFRQLLIYGQSTLIPLVALTLAGLALRSKRDASAGAALALLLVKPQLGLVFAAWALVERRWRLIQGGILCAAGQAAVVWVWFGDSAITGYLGMLRRLPTLSPLLEPDSGQLHSLRALLAPLPAQAAWPVWAVLSLGIVYLAIRAWRSPATFEVRYALLVVAAGLVSPHLAGYDVVILAPALLAIADWVVGEPSARRLAIALYVLYLALLIPTGFFVPFQLSSVVLAFIVLIGARFASQPSSQIQHAIPQ